jgi:hypothetical protein
LPSVFWWTRRASGSAAASSQWSVSATNAVTSAMVNQPRWQDRVVSYFSLSRRAAS